MTDEHDDVAAEARELFDEIDAQVARITPEHVEARLQDMLTRNGMTGAPDLPPIGRFALLAAYARAALRPAPRPPARHRRRRRARPLSADDLRYSPTEYLPTDPGPEPTTTREETDQQ